MVGADGRGVSLSPAEDHEIEPTDRLVVLARDKGGARPSRWAVARGRGAASASGAADAVPHAARPKSPSKKSAPVAQVCHYDLGELLVAHDDDLGELLAAHD